MKKSRQPLRSYSSSNQSNSNKSLENLEEKVAIDIQNTSKLTDTSSSNTSINGKKDRTKEKPKSETSSLEKKKFISDDEDIDQLFTQLKRAKMEKNEIKLQEEKMKSKVENLSAQRKRKKNHSDMIISPDPTVHRFDDATGLPVYKYYHLKVGEGGGTPLCPFDCNCCF